MHHMLQIPDVPLRGLETQRTSGSQMIVTPYFQSFRPFHIVFVWHHSITAGFLAKTTRRVKKLSSVGLESIWTIKKEWIYFLVWFSDVNLWSSKMIKGSGGRLLTPSRCTLCVISYQRWAFCRGTMLLWPLWLRPALMYCRCCISKSAPCRALMS